MRQLSSLNVIKCHLKCLRNRLNSNRQITSFSYATLQGFLHVSLRISHSAASLQHGRPETWQAICSHAFIQPSSTFSTSAVSRPGSHDGSHLTMLPSSHFASQNLWWLHLNSRRAVTGLHDWCTKQ